MKQRAVLVQIDPGLALCWEGDATLRVGFDDPVARVRPVPGPSLELVRSLVSGMRQNEFESRAGGVDRGRPGRTPVHRDPELDELLAALEPALVRSEIRHEAANAPPPGPQSSIRAVLGDDGREVRGIREALQADWLCSFDGGSAPPELAIQVLRFLEPLERTRRWLGDGIAHLLLRFTDAAVLIGPLVSPHGAPCHGCEVLGLVDADPALPSLAAQLTGRVPSSESPSLALLAGAIAGIYVRAWRGGAEWVRDTQLRLPASRGLAAGLPTLRRIPIHSECGCALA